jgi:hypothetical protein
MQKTAQWRSDTRLKLIRLAEMIQAAQRAVLRAGVVWITDDKDKVCVTAGEGQLFSGGEIVNQNSPGGRRDYRN